jgi:hypothetical protein
MGSTFRLLELLKGNPVPFAITYTIGNVIGICSTCFLYGPWSQFKKMFAPTRFEFFIFSLIIIKNIFFITICFICKNDLYSSIFLFYGVDFISCVLSWKIVSSVDFACFFHLFSIPSSSVVHFELYSFRERYSQEFLQAILL